MNNKTLSERMNTIMNRGSEKWLSRSLHEDAFENRRSDHKELIRQLGARLPKKHDAQTTDAPQRIKRDVSQDKIGSNIIPDPEVLDKEIEKRGDALLNPVRGQGKAITAAGKRIGLKLGKKGDEKVLKDTLDRKPKEGGIRFTEPKFTDNQVNSGGDEKRLDSSGNSKNTVRGENSVIEALSAIQNLGLEGKDLEKRILKHFQYKQLEGGAQGEAYTDNEKSSKLNSALKSAEAILHHFDNGQGNDLRFGKMGGQHTDVEDQYRTNIYDDIYTQMFETLGRKEKLKVNKPQGPKGREWTQEEMKKLGRKTLMDAFAGKGNNPSEIEAMLSPTDIYASKADKEDEIRQHFQELADVYTKNDGDMTPGTYGHLVSELLRKKGESKELMGYSLKDITGDNSVYTRESNMHPDKFVKFVNAAINGDVDLKTIVDGNRMKRNFNFDSVIDSLTEDGEDDRFNANFASSTATRPSMYKIEPFGFGAKLGIHPSPLAKDMIKRYSGEDINDNVIYQHEDGTPLGKNYAAIKNSPNYDEDKIQYWENYMQELIDNPSDRFNIGSTPFSMNGEEMEGKQWMRKLLENYNLGEDEDPENLTRNNQPYDLQDSRFDTLSFVRNLRTFKMMRDADKNGKFTDLMSEIIGGAAKVNTSDQDLFFPFTKIANDV